MSATTLPDITKNVRFLASGDTGLTVEFGNIIDRRLSQYILSLKSVIDQSCLPGVNETVPTYRSLTIHYNPLLTSQSAIIESLQSLLENLEKQETTQSNHWRIPVCFEDNEFAPDLAYVADWAGMDQEEVVNIITSTSLYVYMIGFAPGQPYMGDLPDSLAIPRRKNPVTGVPRGALVIATGLAVLYPVDNPTGWHIVGRSPIHLFDLKLDEPVLLKPGDTVSVNSIDRHQYDLIASDINDGTYEPEKLIVQ